MRTILYIDGFNLYFRLLRKRPAYKWLNLKALARNILSPANDIVSIKYFTARVTGRLNSNAPRNQQIYLEALKSIKEISIHMGKFLTTERFLGLIHPPKFKPEYVMDKPWPDIVKVLKTEEKGSDVNLSSQLLFDACRNRFDVAAVLSNDSDLVEPIRLTTQELGKTVGLLSPVSSPNPELQSVSSFIKRIRSSHLSASQFDNPLENEKGNYLYNPWESA